MSYTDYFLKFDNKAAAEAAFLAADIGTDSNGKLPSYTMVGHDAMAIDVLFGTGVVMSPMEPVQLSTAYLSLTCLHRMGTM
jgi:hypothetical protein